MYLPDGWKATRHTRPSCPSSTNNGDSLAENTLASTKRRGSLRGTLPFQRPQGHHAVSPTTDDVERGFRLRYCSLRVPCDASNFIAVCCRRGSDGWFSHQQVRLPANVDIGVHAGTFHNLTFPDQLPVASILLLGENRTCTIGRWSPICEPRFAKL